MGDNPSTQQKLLSAAAAVIRTTGCRHLTLEAVAKEAGVSKGGLLYHFPSKEALLEGLIEAGLSEFNGAIEARTNRGMPWLEAYVEASLTDGELDDLGPALLGAFMEKPELLGKAREAYRAWYGAARERGGIPALRALLALDGLFLHQLLGVDVGLDSADIESILRSDELAKKGY